MKILRFRLLAIVFPMDAVAMRPNDQGSVIGYSLFANGSFRTYRIKSMN